MGIATDIAEYMAQVENADAALKAIDPNFYAVDFLEDVIDPERGYPVAFRTPPEGGSSDKSTGQRGPGAMPNKFPRQSRWVMTNICVMIAPYSNSIRSLTREAERYVEPLYQLYLREYRMNGLVEDTMLSDYKMGRWEFHDTSHYGLVVPVVCRYHTQDQVGT